MSSHITDSLALEDILQEIDDSILRIARASGSHPSVAPKVTFVCGDLTRSQRLVPVGTSSVRVVGSAGRSLFGRAFHEFTLDDRPFRVAVCSGDTALAVAQRIKRAVPPGFTAGIATQGRAPTAVLVTFNRA